MTQSTTNSSCVNYEFYYFILILAYMHFECMCHTRAHLICGSHIHSVYKMNKVVSRYLNLVEWC
jgi:hypothetical protein